MKNVSVIVPNYNYSRYLEQRFQSVFAQTHPIYEIIVLDDASTDGSVEVIETCLAQTKIPSSLVRNDHNSGSVFQQWRKGVELARGDFVWICEADDFSDECFLERVMAKFDDPEVVMGYSQSRQIDPNGVVLAENYLGYTDGIDQKKWKRDYIADGREELKRALSVKNTIPNVSAVVFRKDALLKAISVCYDVLLRLSVVGDWLLYSQVLCSGKIAYISDPLNSHRRHKTSASMSSKRERQLTEILFMQRCVDTMTNLPEEIAEKADTYIRNVSRDWEVIPDRGSSLFSFIPKPENR